MLVHVKAAEGRKVQKTVGVPRHYFSEDEISIVTHTASIRDAIACGDLIDVTDDVPKATPPTETVKQRKKREQAELKAKEEAEFQAELEAEQAEKESQQNETSE